MINDRSLLAIEKNSSESLCLPLYSSYCFSRIPGTIQHLLTEKGDKRLPEDTFIKNSYDLVVFFFIDGFGWRFFQENCERFPFLKRFMDQGIVSKLTSQFPSTTAPHVTCMNTGQDVGESGVYEWFYYEPLVDCVIAPLLFSFARDHNPGTLKDINIPPQQFYPEQSFYTSLAKEGVVSYVMQHQSIVHSHYSASMLKGAKQVPYASLQEALSNLRQLMKEGANEKRYVYLYFGDIDSVGHRHGIHSEQFQNTMKMFWEKMEENFGALQYQSHKKVAYLLSADHGMIDIHPQKTIYINKVFPEIDRFIRRNRQGELIAPAGSCRDFFLYIQQDKLNEAEDILKEILQGKAHLVTTEKLIEQGFFGEKKPSSTLLSRIGNLVILPSYGECVWWYEKHHFEQKFYGAHGGLSRHEMEIPFLFLSS